MIINFFDNGLEENPLKEYKLSRKEHKNEDIYCFYISIGSKIIAITK